MRDWPLLRNVYTVFAFRFQFSFITNALEYSRTDIESRLAVRNRFRIRKLGVGPHAGCTDGIFCLTQRFSWSVLGSYFGNIGSCSFPLLTAAIVAGSSRGEPTIETKCLQKLSTDSVLESFRCARDKSSAVQKELPSTIFGTDFRGLTRNFADFRAQFRSPERASRGGTLFRYDASRLMRMNLLVGRFI